MPHALCTHAPAIKSTWRLGVGDVICNEAIPFGPYCAGVATPTRNVSEYMLVLALCLVNYVKTGAWLSACRLAWVKVDSTTLFYVKLWLLQIDVSLLLFLPCTVYVLWQQIYPFVIPSVSICVLYWNIKLSLLNGGLGLWFSCTIDLGEITDGSPSTTDLY